MLLISKSCLKISFLLHNGLECARWSFLISFMPLKNSVYSKHIAIKLNPFQTPSERNLEMVLYVGGEGN